MNKQEFLDALRRELSALPADELDEAIRYYDEYISEAGGDGADVIEIMGSPRKIAEDFKREYYDKKPAGGNELTVHGGTGANAGERRRNPALYVVLGILIIGFGMPVVRGVFHRLPNFLGVLVFLALIALVIKVLSDRNKSKRASETGSAAVVQTCSDITSVSMNLNSGKYVLRKGASFGIDGEAKSYIRDGVWYIDEKEPDAISTVTVPDGFTARELNVSLGSGSLLIRDITSYSSRLEVGEGSIEADNVFTRTADIRCGTGKVKARLGVNGDVSVKCGAGSAEIGLRNPQSDFNRRASVGYGRVTIGDDTISGSGKIDAATGAFHNISADCGLGEIKITFAQ